MMQAAGGRVGTVGQICMKPQPAAAISRWGGRGGGRGRRTWGGGKWTEGKVAVASFGVRGSLSPTSSHSPVLQPSVRGGEGAAWLLTRGAPLRLWTLPLTHLHPETHTDQPGGTTFSSKLRQIWLWSLEIQLPALWNIKSKLDPWPWLLNESKIKQAVAQKLLLWLWSSWRQFCY